MQFKLECKDFSEAVVKKVMEKSPVKFCGTELVVLRSKRNGSYCEGGISKEVVRLLCDSLMKLIACRTAMLMK